MKTLFIILFVSFTLSAMAVENGKDFNQVIMKDVQMDAKETESAFQKRGAFRGPASVDETEGQRLQDQMNQDKKIEKMNFRQNQPSKW